MIKVTYKTHSFSIKNPPGNARQRRRAQRGYQRLFPEAIETIMKRLRAQFRSDILTRCLGKGAL